MLSDFTEVTTAYYFVSGKLYKKDIVNSEIKEINIYTGYWVSRSYSVPEYCKLLNDYTHLGVALIDYSSKLLFFQDLKVSSTLESILSKYFEVPDFCSFVALPKNIVCDLISELCCNSNNSSSKQIKTGGICKRCKSFDEYAEIKSDGTCLCYNCFY